MNARFKVLVFLAVFLSFSLGYFTSVKSAPAIPPPVVPCIDDPSGWTEPEFHSLRPYQASPCLGSTPALMCGNHVKVLLETVSASCRQLDNDMCPYNQGQSNIHVVIDLSDVKLPILGNTQNVTNSQNPTDEFDDARKLNEYASWYLAGSDQKAEYGVDTNSKIVDFSGPAKKLLPNPIQDFNRFHSLWNAGVKHPTGETDASGNAIEETSNHNQVVVCTKKNFLGLNLPFLPEWLGTERPTPCYEGGAEKEYRLLDWWGSKYAGYEPSKEVIPGWDGSQRWGYKVPPFPWQFTDPIFYEKAYLEWRGKECTIIFKKLLCIDIRIPGVIDVDSNVWADLYQYIPLSNTVDKTGKENYGTVAVSPDAAELTVDEIVINSVPKLFYPHTIEVSEATINLNKTFVPSEGVDTALIPENTEDNTDSSASMCKVIDVRINPGDDLTFDNTKPKHQIDYNAIYTVEAVGNCSEVKDEFGNIIRYNCRSGIYGELDLTTESPYLTDIWQNTTAGAGSTFRRIFPRVEQGAPVSCVADIPGVSPATFELNPASDSSVGQLEVINPPSSTSIPPEIYFPHLGSVYEYFLKGIQTALRPQGYGQPLTNGTTCVPPGIGTGACRQWLLDAAVYNKVIAAANATSCNGLTLNPAWALGIGLNENGGLMTDKVDGSHTHHFGCDIQGAAGFPTTIDGKIDCMVKTLQNDCIDGKTEEQALAEYGYAPGYVVTPVRELAGGVYPPPLWGSGFDVSGIISRFLAQDWRAWYAPVAPIFCPSSPSLPQ